MNSLENPLSTDKSSETGGKDADKDKKKSRLVAARLIDSEVETPKSEGKIENPFESFFDTKKPKDKLFEDKEASENEAPLEKLSEEETQVIASIFREEARTNRSSEPYDDEAEQAIWEALDSYDHKVVEENMEPDEAYAEVMEELGADPAELEAIETELETEQEPGLANELDVNNFAQEIDLSNEAGEIPLGIVIPDIEPDTKIPADAAGGYRGTPPPPPPTTFRDTGGNQDGPIRRASLSTGSFEAGNASSVASPTISPEQNRRERDKDLLMGLLVGGVVGYLIGRRRGRIKTERKLLPIQKKLEKQVIKLNDKLEKQEYTIRKIAVQKAELERRKPIVMSKERPETRAKVRLESVGSSEKLKTEIKKVETKKKSKDAELHIGELLVLSREVKTRPNNSQSETLKTTAIKREAPIRVESLNHQELLKVSEKVIVDGTSLRKIYESQLVGEKGLRRLVTEHLSGGDIKKALKREIVERELDFERDPSLRDMTPSHNGGLGTASSDVALAQMINKAEASVASSQEEVAFLKAKSDFDNKQQSQKDKQVKLVNSALAGTILLLIVFVILLYLTRHP